MTRPIPSSPLSLHTRSSQPLHAAELTSLLAVCCVPLSTCPSKALEQTRLLQKFRAKQHSAAVNSNIEALLATFAAEEPNSHRTSGAKLTTIGATFEAEEETTDVVEEKMRQYIEEAAGEAKTGQQRG